jgi:Ca2+-transporting ATPase
MVPPSRAESGTAAAKAAARARKQRRALLLSASQLCIGLGAAAVASWLLAARVRVPVVQLPFGLYTLAFVAALLSGDALLGAARRFRAASAPPVAPQPARAWHDAPLPAVLAALRCDAAAGLTHADAAARLATHGANELAPAAPPLNLFVKLLDEVHEPQQQLLLAVAVLFALVGEVDEAALALGVIGLMALAEVWTEARAKRAVRSLGAAAPALALARRGGAACGVERTQLVPGDVLVLRAGHEVPADCRLLSARGLACDESTLTGESVPSAKHAGGALPAATPLAERSNMAHAGSGVVRGAAMALVVATGAATQIGAVRAAARAAAAAKPPPTPLQRLLHRLAARLSIAALLASVTGGLLGLYRGMRWQDIILCALSLAFATIPEELPILTAAVLALGARALSARGVFAKRLRALESLACVDTVLIDKTGTLTTGVLRLTAALLPAAADAISLEGEALARGGGGAPMAALADAWRHSAEEAGCDPFDAAARAVFGEDAAADTHADADVCASAAALSAAARVRSGALSLRAVAPFDAARKLSARAFAHAPSRATLALLKGAPDALLPRCTHIATGTTSDGGDNGGATTLTLTPLSTDDAARIAAAVAAAAAHGLRTLAFARAVAAPCADAASAAAAPASVADASPSSFCADDCADDEDDSLEELDIEALTRRGALCFLGVLCFDDPPRREAADAVAACHAAGIRVAVVSGDHAATVAAVARRVGITPHDGGAAPHALHCGEAEAAEAAAEEKHVAAATDAAAADADADAPLAAWAVAAASSGARALARATPAHKLALVRAHAALGRTVLVTGDGANDAPALAAAAVGLAAAGAADAARDAAAVVVLSGDLSSIAHAVREGRRLRDNLGAALTFYLGAKAGLVALFVIGTLWRGFPLGPVQIIVAELYMDLGASLSFCAQPAARGLMLRAPPRADAPFFDAPMCARIAGGGAAMVACVLSGYAWGLYGATLGAPGAAQDANGHTSGTDVRLLHANSMAFVCWLMGHILLALNTRAAGGGSGSGGGGSNVVATLRNPVFAIWALATAALCLLAGTLPGLQSALALRRLAGRDWGVALGVCVGGTCWLEAAQCIAGGVAARRRSSAEKQQQQQQQQQLPGHAGAEARSSSAQQPAGEP